MNTRTPGPARPPERSRRPRGAPPYQNRPVPPPPDGGLSLSPDPASSAASAPHGSGSWGKMRRVNAHGTIPPHHGHRTRQALRSWREGERPARRPSRSW